MKGIQDYYPDHFGQCYGCGRLNEQGYQLKTSWDGDETLSVFTPSEYHTAIPGSVYGGLLASLIDCHGTGSAALALAKEKGIELKEYNAPRCVTGSLQVSYKKPTPIDSDLEIRGVIKEVKGKKVTVDIRLFSKGEVRVTGEVIAIQVPDDFGK
ncbi:PaaI family thioesterase [Ancylomarina euxinus]|uniref:Acyl-coenzyme A thioesterase THEM4 n=1 Tax=Ancylomarina euxinus TaxID=2283627 RepID=A0A425XZ25_9BACT|nr:PaaI family thioesterase [Ancylomarina euxinus]MCZ4695545.1 PaaI family thioesterase [Ancylomarina euxinus]MUP15926.1 PaaI family thioesterase [Ancylomarina euxinus]RRG20367.1 PaaI family thioesterase [Ancylomarina euxinus]